VVVTCGWWLSLVVATMVSSVKVGIGDVLTLELEGHVALAEALLKRLDPYQGAPWGSRPPDVRVLPAPGRPAFAELQNAARDSLITTWDGDALHVVEGNAACRVPSPDGAEPLVLCYEHGFPADRLASTLLRPALQLAAPLRADTVVVHGSAIVDGGVGIVIAGWSESGKTEAALAFLEEGARFLSDKWTFVSATRQLSCFPIGVGVRRWALDFCPTLRGSLPKLARRQLAAAGIATRLVHPLTRRQEGGRVSGLVRSSLTRGISLAERAAVSPTELAAAYGHGPPLEPAPLAALVLLTTVPGDDVVAREADLEWTVRRLVRSASYERRSYFDLDRRRRYVAPDGTGDLLEIRIESREGAILRRALTGVRLIEVAAPFPADPHRVVQAIRSQL
jgi:hypothetical protein